MYGMDGTQSASLTWQAVLLVVTEHIFFHSAQPDDSLLAWRACTVFDYMPVGLLTLTGLLQGSVGASTVGL